jgi:hypothetical protein
MNLEKRGSFRVVHTFVCLTSNSTELHISTAQHISQHIVLDVHRRNDQSPRPDADLAIAQHHT